jgi:lysophospholipid acyltransferase
MYMTMPAFREHNFLYKVVYTNLSMDAVKSRYYLAFKMADSGAIASGFSYEGMFDVNGKQVPRFDRTTMMITRQTELGLTPKEMIGGWNVQITIWLRNCTYQRIVPEKMRNASPLRTLAAMYGTYIISAFWHGFYLTYYIFFV